jgi:putative heme transporter
MFTFVLLLACGVKNALAIAPFAGLADVLPYIGSTSTILRTRSSPRS